MRTVNKRGVLVAGAGAGAVAGAEWWLWSSSGTVEESKRVVALGEEGVILSFLLPLVFFPCRPSGFRKEPAD